jgi:hypothetical protein
MRVVFWDNALCHFLEKSGMLWHGRFMTFIQTQLVIAHHIREWDGSVWLDLIYEQKLYKRESSNLSGLSEKKSLRHRFKICTCKKTFINPISGTSTLRAVPST